MANTAFRSTQQTDTPYFRDRVGEPYNMKHALVDPSHTFQDKTVTNSRGKYNVFYLKKKAEKDSKKLAHERRVTYDMKGNVLLRLSERRDSFGGVDPDHVDPLENFKKVKQANKNYFEEANRAESLEDRVRISAKHTSKERHPETFERGPFKAYNNFQDDKKLVSRFQ